MLRASAVAATVLALNPSRVKAAATGIEGYPTRWTVLQGDTIDFHLSATSGSGTFQVRLYRKGLSEGVTLASGSGFVNTEFVPATSYSTGCGWPVRYSFSVPSTWRSGVYAAQFTIDGFATEILFVVMTRTPGSNSNILMSVATTTCQAYNPWGGKSLYDFNSSGGARSSQVSYLRPLADFARFFDKYEYPFIRWLEKNGIEVEFCSSLDLHANSALLNFYQLFVSVGHDEYWSKEMRDHVEDFVAKGGNAAFFGGNTCWWQVRFSSSNPEQMICYKCQDVDETIPLDPIADPTLKTCHWFTPMGPNRPENSLTGLSSRLGGMRDANPKHRYDFVVRDAAAWVFAGTGVSNGSAFGEADNIVGYETDAAEYVQRFGMPIAVTGADGTAHNFKLLCTANAPWSSAEFGKPGLAFLGMFQNNGTVFNVGTTDWSSGLIPYVENNAVANTVCKITQNVLQALSLPKTNQQKATVNFYQYHAVQTNGDGWRFFFTASPFINAGWIYDGASFRAYRTQQANTVPVYQYHVPQANGDGVRFLLSTDSALGGGWIFDGVCFYAYPSACTDPTNGATVPVYAYHVTQSNGDGIRTLYSRDSNIGAGWILDGVAFHAFLPADF